MSGLDAREQAQLGLKKIEDAVVMLLSRAPDGLAIDDIARDLGLSEGLPPNRRNALASAVLEVLVHTGRILWDEAGGVWRDNPEMG